ncbi:hypothetical protein ILUMI_03455 [Ignelater luminosus]|uniref:Uncharacterized protein n=1 Tax=Ignelater luminosus TaxID=2038154 RepID=A0A8K0GJX4_IGNLU|nr:hypothetical protein ILUMI_03455 [Ignelater luminosus]
MIIPMNLMAALVTVLLRNLLRRLPFVQAPVASRSSFFLSPHLIMIGGAFCYLTRHRYRNWLCRGTDDTGMRIRKSLHEQNHLLSANRIGKAKSWVESNFHSSRRLQQNAILHIVNEASNTELAEQINTIQTTSRFLHKNDCKSEKPLRRRLQGRSYLLSGLPYINKEDLVRRTRSGRVYGIRDSQ